MECFYHRGEVAIGTCRACFRGLCRECAVDLDRALACPNRCEGNARALIEALDQSARHAGTAESARKLFGGLLVTAAAIGIFVILWALALPSHREIALLGVPFLAIALLLLRTLRVPAAKRRSS